MRGLAFICRCVSSFCCASALLAVFTIAHSVELQTIPDYLHVLSLVGVGAVAALLSISLDVARRVE